MRAWRGGAAVRARRWCADPLPGAAQEGGGEEGGSNLNGLVAVTVAIVATFIAVCNVKDGNIVQAMQQAQSSGVDEWSYFQAKGPKLTTSLSEEGAPGASCAGRRRSTAWTRASSSRGLKGLPR